jgi:hypothetical protein
MYLDFAFMAINNELEIFRAMKIHVAVFWVVTSFRRYSKITTLRGGQAASIFMEDPEEGGRKVLRNVGILPNHYAMSQPTAV